MASETKFFLNSSIKSIFSESKKTLPKIIKTSEILDSMGSGKLPKAAMSWSSGKDSSMALYETIKSGKFEIVTLLTTVNSDYDRISMHGVRNELLHKQSELSGFPVLEAKIPAKSSNEIYQKAMQKAIDELKKLGVEYMIFGDIFLQDVRDYRIKMMTGTGIEPIFPLWGRNTSKLALEIIDSGIKARISCLDPRKLPTSLGGAEFNRDLLNHLPENVDPCGENGEFHTFVYSAPFFREPMKIKNGESVLRDNFYFTDLEKY